MKWMCPDKEDCCGETDCIHYKPHERNTTCEVVSRGNRIRLMDEVDCCPSCIPIKEEEEFITEEEMEI